MYCLPHEGALPLPHGCTLLQGVEDAPFYEEDEDKSSDEKGSDEEEGKKDTKPKKPHYVMDSDHRLLLKNCKPLLQSRNAAVRWVWVLAV